MTSRSKIQTVDPQFPNPDSIAAAARILQSGGTVVFPTRCLYGLGADAHHTEAVARIYDIKQRRRRKPILILVHERESLARWAQTIPETGHRLMDRFWPGRLTLVFDARPEVSEVLTGGTGKIGIRLCGHPVARALIQAAGLAITGTSANLSGRPGCPTVESLPPEILARTDLILDAGPLSGEAGSTVVDVTEDAPKILREGVISEAEVFTALGRPPRNTVDKPA